MGAAVIVGGYIFAYLVNGLFGGYDLFYTSDGRRGYTGSLLAHDCIMWQPRFGSYYNKSRHDGIGLFFYPLLRLDQRLVHKTRCVWDDGFDSWSASLSEADIHPKHREAYRRARESRPGPLAFMRAFSALAFSCAFVVVSVGCNPKNANQSTPSLQGTWLLERIGEGINAGTTLHSITKVGSDGQSTCETVATNASKAVRFSLEGVWKIKEGYLVDTVTKHSDPSFTVPTSFRARIVRLTDQAMGIYEETNSVHTVFRKSK